MTGKGEVTGTDAGYGLKIWTKWKFVFGESLLGKPG